MEILVGGANGIVGDAVVLAANENEDISKIFVLSRNPLPAYIASFQKVKFLDYIQFTAYLLARDAFGLASIEACIWCFESDESEGEDENNVDPREMFIAHPILTLRILLAALIPQMIEGKTFRLVFVSRTFAKLHQDKIWGFMRESKRFHTDAEKLLKDAKKRLVLFNLTGHCNLMIVRPRGVMKHSHGFLTDMLGRLAGYIEVDRLARCLVKLALYGSEKTVIPLKDVRKMGKKEEEEEPWAEHAGIE